MNNNYLLEGAESKRLLFCKVQESDFDTWLEFCKHPESLLYILPSKEETPQEKCKIWFDKVFWRYHNLQGGMNALIPKLNRPLS
ncbi:MAG: hypothetical protein SGJ10_10760 [Bacteroidota bacterium]|nr:hypothetical protein [Bacteroidota bacterium]